MNSWKYRHVCDCINENGCEFCTVRVTLDMDYDKCLRKYPHYANTNISDLSLPITTLDLQIDSRDVIAVDFSR